jgi:hypothetical protein
LIILIYNKFFLKLSCNLKTKFPINKITLQLIHNFILKLKIAFCYLFEELISKIKLQFLLKKLSIFNDINLKIYFVIINSNMSILYIFDVTCILNKILLIEKKNHILLKSILILLNLCYF